ncbi:MAG: thioesterase [Ketobacter sp.]|nr:thioesterase [Ketobacter sp.]
MLSDSCSWLLGTRQTNATVRLFCFSHAGGHPGTYLPWQARLGPSVEVRPVQLPGRAQRFHEPSRREFRPLCDELAKMVQRYEDLPVALFGHSLGALLAFEVARSLSLRSQRPRHLFVSGCSAPGHRMPVRPLHELDDSELCQELASFQGTSPAVLADRELMQLLLPVVRDDYALLHDYNYAPATPLQVPLTVLSGREDSIVPANLVLPWANETTEGCDVHWFDGGHFFIDSAQSAVIECIQRKLIPGVHKVSRTTQRKSEKRGVCRV